jgi:hypothetical protein
MNTSDIQAVLAAARETKSAEAIEIANRLLDCIHNGTMHEYRQIAVEHAEDLARAYLACIATLEAQQSMPDLRAASVALLAEMDTKVKHRFKEWTGTEGQAVLDRFRAALEAQLKGVPHA